MKNIILYVMMVFSPFFVIETKAQENLIICNEGNWQSDNGELSYYDAETGTTTIKWFRSINGTKLGDTPNDIIMINDTLIAISVNWSNIIQYIHPDGTACGATEDVPNNRRMCSDGEYLYVTSYAHMCGNETFTKGYVAKIDVKTKKIVATCEVGWEPESICLYKGRLYVANSGGYSFSETSHPYESTIDVVDAESMCILRTIDTHCVNLYGNMSLAGKYLCINSCGDYDEIEPKTIILDCETETYSVLDFPSTYNSTDGKFFYTIGSAYSYLTGQYTYYVNTIDPETMTVTEGVYNDVVTQRIKQMISPYGLYISPYTNNVYITDAKSFSTAGYLYGYTKDGTELFTPQKLFVNPAHFLALPNKATGIQDSFNDRSDSETLYDINGRMIKTAQGNGYIIKNRKKYYINQLY